MLLEATSRQRACVRSASTSMVVGTVPRCGAPPPASTTFTAHTRYVSAGSPCSLDVGQAHLTLCKLAACPKRPSLGGHLASPYAMSPLHTVTRSKLTTKQPRAHAQKRMHPAPSASLSHIRQPDVL